MPWEQELAAEGCPRHQAALALGAAPGQGVTNRPAEGTGEGKAGAAHHLQIWSGIQEILRALLLSGVLQWAKQLNSVWE